MSPASRLNRRRKNNMWHADRMSQKRKSDTAAAAATSAATSEAADLAVSPTLRPSRSSSDIARSSSFQLQQQQQKFIETPVAVAAKGAAMCDIHNC